MYLDIYYRLTGILCANCYWAIVVFYFNFFILFSLSNYMIASLNSWSLLHWSYILFIFVLALPQLMICLHCFNLLHFCCFSKFAGRMLAFFGSDFAEIQSKGDTYCLMIMVSTVPLSLWLCCFVPGHSFTCQIMKNLVTGTSPHLVVQTDSLDATTITSWLWFHNLVNV